MSNADDDRSIRSMAEQTIDEDALAELLAVTTEGEASDETVAALQAVVVDTLIADLLAATQYARRRGRTPTPDDIGEAADDRRDCDTNAGYSTPYILKWEWDQL